MSTTMFIVSASQYNAFLAQCIEVSYWFIFIHHCLVKQFLYLCCTLSASQDKHTIQGAEKDIIP